MSDLKIPTSAPETAIPVAPKTNDPKKIQDAAQQFEALLLGQILEEAHRNADAAAVYLKAAGNPRLPEERRRYFLQSAARLRKGR